MLEISVVELTANQFIPSVLPSKIDWDSSILSYDILKLSIVTVLGRLIVNDGGFALSLQKPVDASKFEPIGPKMYPNFHRQ